MADHTLTGIGSRSLVLWETAEWFDGKHQCFVRLETPMAQTTTPIHVRQLDHVTLIVKDLKRSRDFYVGVLGMQQVPRPGFSFDGLWFQAGATQIHLILEHGESGPSGQTSAGRPKSSRHHHFAFLVDDAPAVAQQLREQGQPVLSGPKDRPDGAVQVFVEDPDGYVVELCSPPKA